jgi:hypothetical protein
MAVQFEEQEYNRTNPGQSSGQGAVTGLVMKLGLAKTAAQANVVMLIIAVIAVALTIYLILPSRAAAPQAPNVANQAPAQGALR